MAEQGARTESGTDAAILDAAERLVQVRGFNGFSYADIAQELSVTKASLHYHFPGKADLGQALIDRYAERFALALAAIEARGGTPVDELDAYAGLYADVFVDHRMCLCGMLAAEYETLPGPMQRIDRQLLRRERGLAREGPHPGPSRPLARLPGDPARHGARDHRRARGRDAGGAGEGHG